MEELKRNTKEGQENLKISTKILNTDQLTKIIYQGKSLPQGKRFLSIEDGGVFENFNLREDFDWHKEDKFYPIIKIGDKIIGLSKLEKDPWKDKNFWISFLSIDPEYEGKGYASKLAEAIFDFAQKSGFSLETSSYSSKKGFEKLKPLFNKLAEKYQINFIDKGKL